jgi:N-hydroxyarylamine O-acetyltransferase
MEAAVNVGAYLDRIAYDGPIHANVETLRHVHRAHMTAVPFENLDIHLDVPIELSVPAFYEKVVTRRRGGFCYELNGLFAWLLSELGYRVTLLSARVASAGRLGPEFDHMTLLVESQGRWIADVGFGDSFLEPLRLDTSFGGEQDGTRYAVRQAADVWTVSRRMRTQGDWEPLYAFSLAPRRLEEFADRSRFQQTSPESHFTRNVVCSRATADGRMTLSGRKLIVTTRRGREERALRDADDARDVLAAKFGVRIDERGAARLFGRSA